MSWTCSGVSSCVRRRTASNVSTLSMAMDGPKGHPKHRVGCGRPAIPHLWGGRPAGGSHGGAGGGAHPAASLAYVYGRRPSFKAELSLRDTNGTLPPEPVAQRLHLRHAVEPADGVGAPEAFAGLHLVA